MRYSLGSFEAWAREAFHNEIRVSGDGAQIFLPRCPICEDSPKGSQRFRHVINLRKPIYWCYRNQCVEDPLRLVARVERLRSDREVLALLQSYGGAFDLTADRIRGEALLGGTHEPAESLTSSPVLASLRERLDSLTSNPLSKSCGILPLPESYSTDWSACALGMQALEYAQRRKLPQWFLASGRVGYCRKGRLHDRLVFLAYHSDGHLCWYTGRLLIDQENAPRYLDPENDEEGGISKSRSVFNADVWAGRERIVVCEGVISALSLEGGVAVFGHALSHAQAGIIAAAKAEAVFVAYDPDVELNKTFDAGEMLRSAGCQDVRIAVLTEGDPAENPEAAEAAIVGALSLDPMEELGEMLDRLC